MTRSMWYAVRTASGTLMGFMKLPILAWHPIEEATLYVDKKNGERHIIDIVNYTPNLCYVNSEMLTMVDPNHVRKALPQIELAIRAREDQYTLDYWRGFEEFVALDTVTTRI